MSSKAQPFTGPFPPKRRIRWGFPWQKQRSGHQAGGQAVRAGVRAEKGLLDELGALTGWTRRHTRRALTPTIDEPTYEIAEVAFLCLPLRLSQPVLLRFRRSSLYCFSGFQIEFDGFCIPTLCSPEHLPLKLLLSWFNSSVWVSSLLRKAETIAFLSVS